MQRPVRPKTIVTAGAGALVGGVAVGASPLDDSGIDVSGFLPVVCVTSVALFTVRRWLTRYEKRTKAGLNELVRRHQSLSEDLDERERQVRAKEALLIRREHLTAMRVAGLADQLDVARNTMARERVVTDLLRKDYEEVTADYNALIQQVLADGADRFTRPTAELDGPPPCSLRRGPSVSVDLFGPRQRHESV